MFFFFSPSMNRLYESPCGRTAALMRTCHKRRKVRFLARRSRKAIAPALRTAVRASLILDLRPHIIPFVFLRRFRRRLTCWVPRLTRGIIVEASEIPSSAVLSRNAGRLAAEVFQNPPEIRYVELTV